MFLTHRFGMVFELAQRRNYFSLIKCVAKGTLVKIGRHLVDSKIVLGSGALAAPILLVFLF